MADVHVTVKNNSGQTVALLMDDERDAERIEDLRKRARREELDSVKVSKAPAAKAAADAGKS